MLFYSRVRIGLLLGALVCAGIWLRSLPREKFTHRAGPHSGVVNLYFRDGALVVPVSRRITNGEVQPRAAMDALLAGPNERSGLMSAIPRGVNVRSLTLNNSLAEVDLSSEFAGAPDPAAAQFAVVETLTALPGVRSVSLKVDGKPLAQDVGRTPLLYYASRFGMGVQVAQSRTPRDMVMEYLHGPNAAPLTGLPADIRLLKYDYAPAERSVSLQFSYPPSLRTLALEAPERMRFVLLGLIASLTEFAEVEVVQLDFEGRARLGVGQCADLLRTPQPRPALLNDERLLSIR